MSYLDVYFQKFQSGFSCSHHKEKEHNHALLKANTNKLFRRMTNIPRSDFFAKFIS